MTKLTTINSKINTYNFFFKTYYQFFIILFLENLLKIFLNKENSFQQYIKNSETLLLPYSNLQNKINYFLFNKKTNNKLINLLYTIRILLNTFKNHSSQEINLYLSNNNLIPIFIYFFKKHTNLQCKLLIDINVIDTNFSNNFFDIISYKNSNLNSNILLLKNLNTKLIKTLTLKNIKTLINQPYMEAFILLKNIEQELINKQYKYINLEFGYKYNLYPIKYIITYHLLTIKYNTRINLISYLVSLENPLVLSITNLFKAANWYEREIWDLYGLFFKNHNDLRRILTDYGFEGYPFRKDFPLNGYLEIKYNDIEKRVIYEPIEFNQEFRYFSFLSNWDWQ